MINIAQRFMRLILIFSVAGYFTLSPSALYGPMSFIPGIANSEIGNIDVAHAAGSKFKKKFRNLGKKINRGTKKASKRVKRGIKNKNTQRALIGIGAVLVAGGIAKKSPAAAIIGAALVAAPIVLQKSMAKKYGKEMNWSGCVQCNKRRIVRHPNRNVSKQTTRKVNARVTADVKDVQRALAKLSLYKGGIDGDFGPGTRRGVTQFQTSLNEEATGYLSAEQRHKLFASANEKGYVRTAALNELDDAQLKPIPATLPNPAIISETAAADPKITGPVLVDFRLAKSQFSQFSNKFLTNGSLAAVTTADLLPDGRISLEIKDPVTGQVETLIGEVTNIEVAPHSLAEEWVQISYAGEAETEKKVLNTRDDFGTVEEAETWIADAKKRLGRVEKLVQVRPDPSENETSLQIAKTPTVQRADDDGRIVLSTPKEQTPKATKPISTDAELTKKEPGEEVVAQSEVEPETPSSTVEDPKTFEVTEVVQESDNNNTLTGFTLGNSEKVCRQNVYVSFNFPTSDKPLTHYNILPPEGVLMVDNGDSTAYFTGNCVQGNYDFSYVFIREAAKKEDWRDVKRAGGFQLAKNSEQCAVDLNTPNGQATIKCF